MNFVFDNNLSPRVARALNELDKDNTIVSLRSIFDPSTSDVDWMMNLSRSENWIALTGDYRISRLPHEASAWRETGLVIFFLRPSWQNLQFWEYSSKIVKRWPLIVTQAKNAEPGDGFDVQIRSTSFRRF